jgi:GLPGLI family protein
VYDYVEYNVFRSNHLKEHELFCVEIGDRLSRYYSLKQLEGDSLFYTTPQAKREYQRRIRAVLSVKGDNKTNRLEKMGQIMPGGSEDEVYKNYPVQDSMLVYNGWHGRTKYTETMMPQAWEIHSDTMLFLGYTCQKATCQWRQNQPQAMDFKITDNYNGES